MPTGFLSDAERARFNEFPEETLLDDVIAYFTLSASDRAIVPRTSSAANRLGFAIVLGSLRYLGFCPDLRATPRPIVDHVAEQLGVPTDGLKEYGRRRHTWVDHYLLAQAHLGFRRPTMQDKSELTKWLVERALEHDRAIVLLELACDRVRSLKLVRPGLSRLERARDGGRVERRTAWCRRCSRRRGGRCSTRCSSPTRRRDVHRSPGCDRT